MEEIRKEFEEWMKKDFPDISLFKVNDRYYGDELVYYHRITQYMWIAYVQANWDTLRRLHCPSQSS